MPDSHDNVYLQLSELMALTQDASSETEIYQITSRLLPRIIDADRASVALFDEESGEIELIGLNVRDGGGVMPVCPALPVNESMVGKAIHDQKAKIWIPDRDSSYVDSAELAKEGYLCAMNAPLMARDVSFGCLNVASKTHNAFQAHHLELMQRIASLLSLQSDRRRLLEHTLASMERFQNYANRLEILNAVSQSLSSATNEDEVFSKVAEFAEEIIAAERISLAVLESDGKHFQIARIRGNDVIPAGTQIALKNTSVEQAFATKETVFLPSLDKTGTLGSAGLQQSWSTPILIADDVIGVLNVATSEVGITDEDATAIFEAIARSMGLAIERIRAQQQTESTLKNLVDESPLMLVVLGEDGIIQRVSRFGSHILGYRSDELVGQPFVVLHPDSGRIAANKRIQTWRRQAHSRIHSSEVQMQIRDGSVSWVRQSARVTNGADGKLQILVSCENVDNIRALTGELRHQARTDQLTGTPNRLAFREQLAESIERANHINSLIAVMFIDLDHFKDVNDTLGHDSGDQLLCIVAEKIKRQLRECDIVSRSGGDEFTVMIPDARDTAAVSAAAQRILDTLQQPVSLGRHEVHIACSIGICCFPECSASVDEMIKNADIAMYRAKTQGRNNYQYYSPDMSQQLMERVNIESDLRDALKNSQLRLMFQPQYDLLNGEVIGCEALVRWDHPSKGLICPAQFIPVAESTGMMDELTGWVMQEAFRVLRRLQRKKPALRMSINVSAKEFGSRSTLLKRVTNALSANEINANHIELEITESALIDQPQDASDVIRALSSHGVSLAIDDFGTGYASFNNLLDLPLQQIKIDREFVAGITLDNRNKAIVDGIITMARKMNLSCIAEGIETIEQLSVLRAMNCRYAQGFLLSHPLDDKAFEAILEQPLTIVRAC